VAAVAGGARQNGQACPGLSGLLTVTAAVHGGVDRAELERLSVDAAAIVDFSANQSPLGVSAAVRQAVGSAILDKYPDRDAVGLTRALAARHGLTERQVVVGNGSTELIRLLTQVVLRPGDSCLSLGPSFGEYRTAVLLARGRFVEHRLSIGSDGPVYDHEALCARLRARPRLCWLCSPHNPIGIALPSQAIAHLVDAFPDTIFVLDEAYVDLLTEPQWTAATLARGNFVVLRSMTKTWGLAGLRLGYALAPEAVAGPLRSAKAPWSVNACALAAGEAALADEAFYRGVVDILRDGREQLMSGLRAQGWRVLPSAASFFLVEVDDACEARKRLLSEGCLVRDCTSFGLPAHVRVSPRLPEQNARLLEAFARLAAQRRGRGGTRAAGNGRPA
jgi:histidinol-phosphate aminotransferase